MSPIEIVAVTAVIGVITLVIVAIGIAREISKSEKRGK